MLEHGGALRAAAACYDIPLVEWLDLSTGINPNGWPVPGLPATVWQRLPEPEDGLVVVASAYYGTAHLLPVAGSQAAIQALPLLRPCGRVGVLHPTYAEHAYAWRRAGHEVEHLTVEQLAVALDRFNTVVVVNPNNPTGLRFSPAVLLDWRERLAARAGWLVVDEAFMDATPNDSLASYVGLPGLIVLRSLGKFYGLAGARAGFALAEPAVLERLSETLGPWAVSGPGRWVTMQALADVPWQQQARLALAQASQRLADLLHGHGLTVAGGTTLFQWVPLAEAEFWQAALAQRGLLVRRFTDPLGLRFGLPDSDVAWRRLELALAAVRAERLGGL